MMGRTGHVARAAVSRRTYKVVVGNLTNGTENSGDRAVAREV
jgi:hypothetical protein